VLIETLPAAFEMEEILYELRDHSSGLNAGRWDYIFSYIKTFAHRGNEYVLPDRSQITMTTPFMRSYTELLVSTCHRRGAHAIGGMAAFVPNKADPTVTEQALAKVKSDKEREAADKLQKLILGELHHRIKNTLATVSAIASQSFRTATSIEHGQTAMEGRLLALGRAHDLLMQISWSNASLTHTFSDATEPYDNQGTRRFHFNGPDIRITSGAVVALAMTLNELCTNTTKFGALSDVNGRVEISWTIDEDKKRMRLTWTEKGGPPVQRPTRRSFGTRMMESLGQQLNGRVQLTYDPSGFVYLLDVPLGSIIAVA